MAAKELEQQVRRINLRERIGDYENVVAAFQTCDANRDGFLTWKELHSLLAALHREQDDNDRGEQSLARLKKKGWTESHTLALTEMLDKDGNGKIDINEFLAFIFPRKEGMDVGTTQYEKIMYLFQRFDSDRNGRLDQNEYHQLMLQLEPKWTTSNTSDVWNEVDQDGNGYVESAELINWLFRVPKARKIDARAEAKASARDARAREMARGGRQVGDLGHGVEHDVRRERATRTSVKIDDKVVRHTGRTTVAFGQTDPTHHAHDDRSHTRGKHALVVVEILCGKDGGESKAKMCQHTWNMMLGGQVRTKIVIDNKFANAVLKVSARDGQLVFWDHATMVLYRDDPFRKDGATLQWAKDLANNDLSRLIDGTYLAAGL